MARVELTGQWSPRVGVVWDPRANGRSKLFASYGRFYQPIPQSLQIQTMGNEYWIYAINYTADRLDLVNVLDVTPSYIDGSDYVPPGLKGIYQDEIVAGVEAEVWKDWSVGSRGSTGPWARILEDRCDLFDPRSGLGDLVPPEAATNCALMNPGRGISGSSPTPRTPTAGRTTRRARSRSRASR